jgi:hypothetical protein
MRWDAMGMIPLETMRWGAPPFTNHILGTSPTERESLSPQFEKTRIPTVHIYIIQYRSLYSCITPPTQLQQLNYQRPRVQHESSA